jgi:hypothetical protein
MSLQLDSNNLWLLSAGGPSDSHGRRVNFARPRKISPGGSEIAALGRSNAHSIFWAGRPRTLPRHRTERNDDYRDYRFRG